MRRTLTAAVFAFLYLAAAGASAQAPPLDEFSVARFSPAPGPGNFLGVEGARVGGHLVPSAGLTLDYAYRPFTLYSASCPAGDTSNCEAGEELEPLVRYYALGHLHGAISLFQRYQIGLVVPFGYTKGDQFSYTLPDRSGVVEVPGGSAFGLGDPRLSLKARILGEGLDGIGFAASAFVTAPIGQLTTSDHSFLGESTITAGGSFIGEFRQRGVHLAGNVGGIFRPTQTLFSTEVGSQLTYGVALGYDLTPLVNVFAEVQGASSFSTQVDENPLEGRLAGRFRVGDLHFTLGAGAGLISGVGVPLVRAFGQVQYAPVRVDSDGDGIDDSVDACPSEPEDFDGWEDEDGCPDPDNDGDGIPDHADQCPDEPEDFDGWEDEDGCPDPDNDGDGILDGYDSCPNEPENFDGYRDEDGCPEAPDRDGDGIPDDVDLCPDEPEDTDGYGDEDGCPEDDFDGDGIPDDEDECPDQPETFNGFEDEDGCPEPDSDGDGVVDALDRCPDSLEDINGIDDEDGCPDGPPAVTVAADRVTLIDALTWRRRTTLVPQSRRQLSAVAFALRNFPQFVRIRVEVTAGDEGLAQQRALAVVEELVANAVAADRMRVVTQVGDEATAFMVDPVPQTSARRAQPAQQ